MKQTQQRRLVPAARRTPGRRPPVRLRTAGPDDAGALTAMLASLSPASGFHRFLAGVGTPKPALVRALVARDSRRGAVLAVRATGDGEDVVGHACWSVDARGVADVGVVVADVWQRRGLGRRLTEAAVGRAGQAGASALHLDVHPENRAVVRLLRERIPSAATTFTGGLVQFDVPLADLAASRRHPAPAA
ncbi:MAG: N-acetyltransferase family protein [Kineosporiaceae bacterium]